MAMDLNSLLQSFTGTADARTKAYEAQAAEMTAQTDELQRQLTVNVEEARKVAETASQIAADKAQVDFVRNKALQEAVTIYGVNPDENNSIIASRMAEYTAAEEERKVARQKFDQLAGVNLLDNPIGYIFAQLQLPQAAAANNAIVAKRDAAANDIATRQQLANAQKQITVANSADAVKALQIREAENAQANANVQLNQALAENSSKIAGQRLQIFQLKDKAFDIQGDVWGKQMQVAQFQMNFESLQLQREQARIAAKEREDRLKEAAKNKADQELELTALNTNFASISKFLGMQVPMNVAVWKALPDAKQKQAWLAAAQSGQIGPDILTSLQFINTVGNLPAMTQTNPGVATAIQGFSQAIANTDATLSRKPEVQKLKQKERLDLAADEYMKLIVDSAKLPTAKQTLTATQFDTIFNPYKANHKVMMMEPALADNAVTKAMQAATQGKDLSQVVNVPAEQEQLALRSIVDRVKRRELGPDAAARDIVTYFGSAAKRNFELYQYTNMGVPLQTNYMARIEMPGLFGEPITADLMNFASVKNALTKAAVASTAETTPFIFVSRGALVNPASAGLSQLFSNR